MLFSSSFFPRGFHGCCWEAVYLVACALVRMSNPTTELLTLKLLPFQGQPSFALTTTKKIVTCGHMAGLGKRIESREGLLRPRAQAPEPSKILFSATISRFAYGPVGMDIADLNLPQKGTHSLKFSCLRVEQVVLTVAHLVVLFLMVPLPLFHVNSKDCFFLLFFRFLLMKQPGGL